MRRLLGEVLLGGVRLSHALAAALWIGGTLVFALMPTDSAVASAQRPVRAFRQALRAGISVFILSGALLAVERLGSAQLPPTYFGILVVKIALGIWMFFVAREIGAPALGVRTGPFGRAEYRVLILGAVIYALALALRAIYEGVIRG